MLNINPKKEEAQAFNSLENIYEGHLFCRSISAEPGFTAPVDSHRTVCLIHRHVLGV